MPLWIKGGNETWIAKYSKIKSDNYKVFVLFKITMSLYKVFASHEKKVYF